LPCLTKNYYINFYGGEPLLSLNSVKKTISFLKTKNKELNKRANYSITTNGSLLTEETIQFLNEHKFSVELSFDGLAQDVQRKKGSFKKIVLIIEELLKYSDIGLEVNSVYTPKTVDSISESIKSIMALDVPNIHFAITIIEPWDQISLLKLENEMLKLRKILLSHYKIKGNIPVINFREGQKKGIFYCAAGKDRLAITPKGEIWGCFLFPDYFKGKKKSPEYQKFFFGTLDHFINNHKNIYHRIYSNYSQLSMDNFSTSNMRCFLCSELENCAICPINVSLANYPLGKIPRYVCEIQKIKIRIKKEFQHTLKKSTKLSNPNYS